MTLISHALAWLCNTPAANWDIYLHFFYTLAIWRYIRFETLTPIFGAFRALQTGTRPAKICHAFNGRGQLVCWPARQASEFVHVVPATCGRSFCTVQLLVLDKVENPPL